MSLAKNPGRYAGAMYFLMGLPAPFALIYLPGKLIVHGDATATANNIAAHALLFRTGIVAQLISQALFIYTVIILYELLKGVNERRARLMVGFVLAAVPIAFLNEVNSIAALILARRADFLSAFEKPQRDAAALLFLNLHTGGIVLAQILWGICLLPLGLLVYRSGFIPRILGVLLILNAFVYPVLSLTYFLAPQYGPAIARYAMLPELGELWFILWLLIMGAKPKPLAAPAYSPAGD
jgi:hypothetical protein